MHLNNAPKTSHAAEAVTTMYFQLQGRGNICSLALVFRLHEQGSIAQFLTPECRSSSTSRLSDCSRISH